MHYLLAGSSQAERQIWYLGGVQSHHEVSILVAPSTVDSLPKAPTSKYHDMGIRTSAYEFWGDTNTQTTARLPKPNLLFPQLSPCMHAPVPLPIPQSPVPQGTVDHPPGPKPHTHESTYITLLSEPSHHQDFETINLSFPSTVLKCAAIALRSADFGSQQLRSTSLCVHTCSTLVMLYKTSRGTFQT